MRRKYTYWRHFMTQQLTLPQGAELLVRDLADPTIIFLPSRNKYLLSGTWGNTSYFPLFLSDDGVNFQLEGHLVPRQTVRPVVKSKLGINYLKNINASDHRFCWLWAPDFHLDDNNNLVVMFSGASTPEQSCDADDISSVTTFSMTIDQLNFDRVIKPPTPVDYSQYISVFGLKIRTQLNPSAFEGRGCHDRGSAMSKQCERTIRIDSNWFVDPKTGERHLFYVWPGRRDGFGNLISSYNIDQRQLTSRIEPTHKQYEAITEAPDVFFNNGFYYLVFSHGGYNMTYGMSYIMSHSLAELTLARPHKPLLRPILDFTRVHCSSGYSGNRIEFAGGHSKTSQIGNNWYIYYHVNEMVDRGQNDCHHLLTRHTVRQELSFDIDGHILPLN